MKPTYEQIKLLETILTTQAFIETIKPRIHAIYNEVMDYMIPPKYLVHKRTGEKITHYNDLYLLDRDAQTEKHVNNFYKEVNQVLIEKGFKPNKEGCCFLLEWESVLRDLQREFVKACCKTLPVQVLQGKTSDEFFEMVDRSYNGYKKMLDLNIRYVIGFVDTKKLTNQLTK